MANEDLIYRITRAIYERLGSTADENAVEQLVTDIYQTIEPALAGNGGDPGLGRAAAAGENTAAAGSADRLIISVFGMDHPGIVAGVSQILADASCSIVDINQTVVQGKFAMVIIANMARAQLSVSELKEQFRNQGKKLGVHVYAQREDLFNAMHRI